MFVSVCVFLCPFECFFVCLFCVCFFVCLCRCVCVLYFCVSLSMFVCFIGDSIRVCENLFVLEYI